MWSSASNSGTWSHLQRFTTTHGPVLPEGVATLLTEIIVVSIHLRHPYQPAPQSDARGLVSTCPLTLLTHWCNPLPHLRLFLLCPVFLGFSKSFDHLLGLTSRLPLVLFHTPKQQVSPALPFLESGGSQGAGCPLAQHSEDGCTYREKMRRVSDFWTC